jgi:hypothetical protein
MKVDGPHIQDTPRHLSSCSVTLLEVNIFFSITNCSPNVKQQSLTPVNTFRILPVVNQDLMIRINSNV